MEGLTRRFGKFTAVDGISFSVKKGEIFAFLGPNGAGKSTTIKMLITLLSPSAGNGVIAGHSIATAPAKVRRVIGYVPQMISVDGALTAEENLMLMARLYDIPGRERARRVHEMLRFLDLHEHRNSLARTFSGGMVRKLEIGQAVLHHPHVLFLDEPTLGLDPIAKQNVWHHLRMLNKRYNTTIFFSTHNMEEAEEVSGRIAVMNQGRIASIGTAAELKAKAGKKKATLEDAFIALTGGSLQEKGDFRAMRQTRQVARRLG